MGTGHCGNILPTLSWQILSSSQTGHIPFPMHAVKGYRAHTEWVSWLCGLWSQLQSATSSSPGVW